MHIIHIASELSPIAKVGGLGDVIQGLSNETAKHHQVEILLPKYDCIDYSGIKNLEVEMLELWSNEGSFRYNNTVWKGQMGNLTLLLIEPHHPGYYFSRGKIYGCPDDIERFTYFSRACMEYLLKSGKKPDVIHIHDWPIALVAPLFKEVYRPAGLKAGGTLLTLHNMQHQGVCSPQQITRSGLSGDSLLTPDRMQDPASPGFINLLKGGIVYADQITTVSPNYEKEILTPEGGFGLNGTLLKHRKKLTGILNGIDETYWDPSKDPHLIAPYETHKAKIKSVVQAKAENKKHLRAHFRLKEENRPLVAAVTRLVEQKGPHLIGHAIERTLEWGGQFVLLGSSAEPEIEASFHKLQAKLAKNPHVAFCFDRNEALAHQIYAGADLFIIPSLFEPCGLTQLIALRYATVPIARMTGGLVDTVFDIDTSPRPPKERNGFTFDYPDAAGVDWALKRALATWKDSDKWQSLMQHGMAQDFSWTHSAKDYFKIYKKLQLH